MNKSRFRMKVQPVVRALTVAFIINCCLWQTACSRSDKRDSQLDGQWSMHLHVASLRPGVIRGADSTVGVIVFSNQLPDFPEWVTASDPPRPYAAGRFQIDLDTVFGIPSTGEPPADLSREVLAMVRGDSIWMSFIPRAADAGIAFRGVLRHDSVVGHWQLRGYAPGARGVFRMYRVQKTAIFDSLVTQGREAAHEEDE